MAKNSYGDTALHYLCCSKNKHEKPVDKIKLILEVADIEKILQAKNFYGRTPLQYAIIAKGSTEIQDLLGPSKPLFVVYNNDNATAK